MSLADYDAQISKQTASQPSSGGLASYDSVISNGGTWNVPAQQPQAPKKEESPFVSINQSAQQEGGSLFSDLSNFGHNFVTDAGQAVSGIYQLATKAPVGAVADLLNKVGVDTPKDGYVADSQKFANALPGAVAQIPGQLADTAQTLYNTTGANGQEAADKAKYDTANYVFQHPFNTLLNISGVGDLVGSGAMVAGDLSDQAALTAAKGAADLTPEEAATASLANTSKLSTVGSQIGDVSHAINPISTVVNAGSKVGSGIGSVLSKILGFTTGTGEDGVQAIRDLYSGPKNTQIVQLPDGSGSYSVNPYQSTLNGMKSGTNDVGNAAMREAIGGADKEGNMIPGSINERVAENTAGGLIDMNPVRERVQSALQQYGINPQVASPEELQSVNNYLELLQKSKGTEYIDPQSFQDASAKALQVYGKYNLGPQFNDLETQIRNGLNANRYRTSNYGPSLQSVNQSLEDLSNKNGYVGIAPGISSIPKSVQSSIEDIVEKIYRTGGGGGGYEANAQNLQNLKNLASNLYDPRAATGGEHAGNALSTTIRGSLDDLLKQYPEYGQATDLQKAGYRGQDLKGVLPSSNIQKGVEGAVIGLLSHFVNPGFLGATVAASPRLVGELANISGKVGRVGSALASPITAAAESSPITALLNLLGGNH